VIQAERLIILNKPVVPKQSASRVANQQIWLVASGAAFRSVKHGVIAPKTGAAARDRQTPSRDDFAVGAC